MSSEDNNVPKPMGDQDLGGWLRLVIWWWCNWCNHLMYTQTSICKIQPCALNIMMGLLLYLNFLATNVTSSRGDVTTQFNALGATTESWAHNHLLRYKSKSLNSWDVCYFTLCWLLNLRVYRDQKTQMHLSFLTVTPLVWPNDNFDESTNSSNNLVLSNAPSSLVWDIQHV